MSNLTGIARIPIRGRDGIHKDFRDAILNYVIGIGTPAAGPMITVQARTQNFLTWGVLVLGFVVWFSTAQRTNPVATSAVPQISVIDAVSAIAKGALVIDVRERDAFERGHIVGALAVPLEELRRRATEFAAMTDKEMIIYCGDGSTLGPEGTKVLTDAGHPDAKNLTEGYSGWKTAGHPVASGAK